MKEHSDKHYEETLQKLRERVLAMGARVERMIGGTMRSLVQRDEDLAREMIDLDKQVDSDERAIDQQCLALLAQRQPVAGDLRFISICMKVVTDLERVGDLAVNIGERALDLIREEPLKPLVDLPRMAELAQGMVHRAMDALVAKDPQRANEVLASDDEVDALNRAIFKELMEILDKNPGAAKRAVGLMFVSKYLERIADHATNVAEMVIFWAKGEDIRHGTGAGGA